MADKKTELQKWFNLKWKNPMTVKTLDNYPLSSNSLWLLKEFWTDVNITIALNAKSGYAVPTVLNVRSIKKGKQEVDYVNLRQLIDKRPVTYRAIVTFTGGKKLKIEVCVWPIGAGSPFYIREGIVWEQKGLAQPNYRVKALPVPSIYGQRRGIDPLTIGHKYPH